MQNIRQKATKGVAWSAIGNWGNQLTTFVVFIILTRLLAPEAFGLVAMATVFTSFVAIFAEQGLGQALVQREHLDPEHLDTAFWTNVITGSGLTILGIFLSGLIAQIYGESQLRPVVALLSVTFLLTALSSTQYALLQRDLNFRALSTRQLLAAIVGGAAGIVMAFMGAGVYALVGKTLVTGLIGTITLWRVSDWRPRFSYSRAHFRDLFGFGLSMVGVNTTIFFQTRMDDFLIGLFLGAEALGYYTVAYRLGRLTLGMFTSVMSNVAVPTFAKLQNDSSRLQIALNKFSSMAGLITFPIFMGLIVLAPDMIIALSGDKWLPSVPSMRILSLAGFSLSLQYFLAYLVISLGKPNHLFLLNLMVTIVTAVSFSLSAPFGITYVAMAYAVVNVFFYAAYVIMVRRILTLDLRLYFTESWRFFIPTVFMGIIMYLVNLYLLLTPIGLYLRLFFVTASSTLLYFAIVFLFYKSVLMELWDIVFSILPLGRRTAPQTHISS